MTDDNPRVVLIAAPPSMGKTHSLYKMADDSGVAYLNTDLKDLPFRVPKSGMKVLKIDDAMIAPDAIQDLEENYPEVHTVILDTVTFLMNQYENQYVLNAADTRKAWQSYGQFYGSLMHNIKCSTKNFIVLAHTFTEYNESEMANETRVPIKGAVGKVGAEADYNIVLSARKVTVKQLEPYLENNKLLTLSPKEERIGVKYVFQTDLTKETLSEKIRSPMGLWTDDELYINNDISLITQRLSEYYSEF